MSTRLMKWLLAGCGALALGCVAVPAIVLLGRPTAHQAARQRWEQRGPRHYEFAALVASGMVTYHVRVEVWDNQIVGGFYPDTGQPLNPSKLGSSRTFLTIDNLFALIDKQARIVPDWRSQLARYQPRMARWLDPCTEPLPQAQYDAELGFPTRVIYDSNPCPAMATPRAHIEVEVEQFSRLPE